MKRPLASFSSIECDLVFGEAIAANLVADDEELAGKLLYSRPYYRTGYVLVERKNGPHVQSLAELKGAKSQRLGTEAGSVADYTPPPARLPAPAIPQPTGHAQGLDDGDIDHAYFWANVGWALHTTPEWNLELVANYVPVDHWDIAIAMDRGDDELKRQVDAVDRDTDQGWNGCARAGSLPRALFTRRRQRQSRAITLSSSNLETIHHPVADRGREPQMQKVQTSKQGVLGIEPHSDPRASWSWVWIRTTFRIRRPTRSRRGLSTRLPVCLPRSWEFGFGSTGLIPRTILIRQSFRKGFATCFWV